MPKIIDNLHEKIFECSLKLFGEYGYNEVNMKRIAKELDIAVGTLYNYYPNKQDLFFTVLKKSWQQTFFKLDKVKETNYSSRKKLKYSMKILYDEIENRKGLGKELTKANVIKKESLDGIKDRLDGIIRNLVEELKKEEKIDIDKEIEERLIRVFFLSVIDMLDKYAKEKENNIKFINYIIDCNFK